MTPRRPRLLPAAALLLAALTPLGPPVAAEPPAPAAAPPAEYVLPPAPPLEAMNGIFRAGYGRARDLARAEADPVILVRHGRLTLLSGGRREEADVIPPMYHRLKEVAHAPLAVYVLLAPWAEGPIADDRLADLRRLRDALVEAGRTTGAVGFDAAQAGRQDDLLGRTRAFVDSVLEGKRLRRDELDAFARSSAPLVLANAADAAALQIDGYSRQVAEWKRSLPPGHWDRLRVVVIGRQLPRKGNVAVQYFARLLGVAGAGPRLVYAEELSGDEAALGLLATHQLDRAIGRAFFGDPSRMERDLLGDGAAAYLRGKEFGP